MYIAQYDRGEFKFFELCQYAWENGDFTDYWSTTDNSEDLTWQDVRHDLKGGTIQSLAAHDAQIRVDAWDEGFTEGRDLAVSGRPMSRNNPYKEQKQ